VYKHDGTTGSSGLLLEAVPLEPHRMAEVYKETASVTVSPKRMNTGFDLISLSPIFGASRHFNFIYVGLNERNEHSKFTKNWAGIS
jgi:hypothetical protein